MDMELSSCWDCGPDLASYVILALFFIPPIGAFVMRKHIAEATGAWRWAGRALQALAVMTSPVCALVILVVIAGLLD